MNVGDVVRLRSGGPVMTVTKESSAAGDWVCEWFTVQPVRVATNAISTVGPTEPWGHNEMGVFPEACLDLVDIRSPQQKGPPLPMSDF